MQTPTTTIALGQSASPVTTTSGSPSATASGSSASSQPNASSTPTPTGAESQFTPQPTSSSSGGLSSGAKAGIGGAVGGVAAVLLFVVAFILWRRRSRRARPAELGDEKYAPAPAYKYAHEAQAPVEAPGNDVHPQDAKYEMAAGPQVVSELPGSTVGQK